MNHPYGSSMFLDLDKPLLKDPRERIDSAMEWEAISEMYAQRDEHRRRTGFVKDLHEERGFTLNPITGRYRDASGFNPPRRISKPALSDLPVELNAMIVENIRDPTHRHITRGIDILHRDLTTSIGDRVQELISGYRDPIDEETMLALEKSRSLSDYLKHGPYKMKGKKEKQMDIVKHVYTELLKGTPIKVIRTSEIHMFLEYHDGQPYRESLQLMRRWGDLDLYYNDMGAHYPSFWKHYPFVREIFMEISRRLNPDIRYTVKADEDYRRYSIQ